LVVSLEEFPEVGPDVASLVDSPSLGGGGMIAYVSVTCLDEVSYSANRPLEYLLDGGLRCVFLQFLVIGNDRE